jgi:hypothetical protein
MNDEMKSQDPVEVSPSRKMKTEVTGCDEFRALQDAATGLCVLVTAACIGRWHPDIGPVWLAASGCLVPVVLFLALGARFRCSVCLEEGIVLEKKRLWFYTCSKERFFLDASLTRFVADNNKSSRGLCWLTVASDGAESDFFGPFGDAKRLGDLEAKLQQALATTRTEQACLLSEQAFGCELFDGQEGALDLDNASWSAEGRLLSVSLKESVVLKELVFPPATVLHFNRKGFVDSCRPDELISAVLSEPLLVEFCGLEMRAGGCLDFDAGGRVICLRDGLSAALRWGDLGVDDAQPVAFSVDGDLSEFTLSQPWSTDRMTLPGGSRVMLLPKVERSARMAGVAHWQVQTQESGDTQISQEIAYLTKRDIVHGGSRLSQLPLHGESSSSVSA